MTESRVHGFSASDGSTFQLTTWEPAAAPKAQLVILHGVQSHAGWYDHLGRMVSEAGYMVHFPDRRGSGANTQDRGHSPSDRRLLDDVSELLAAIRAEHPS